VTDTIAAQSPDGTVPKSLLARIIGVLTAPRATYAGVAARPRWLGVLLFVMLVGAGATFVFLSTEVGKTAVLDQQTRMMESFGVKLDDAASRKMEQGVEYARYTGPIFQAIFLPLIGLLVSGIVLAVFNAILGGSATFKQVFAIVAHSGVVITLAGLFGLPLAYARETMTSSTSLAVLLPFLDDNSFAARFFGAIDLFQIWWLVSLAIGLGVLYRRKTGPIATGLIAVYVTIGLVIAAVKTALSGA
jgi:Yip1 domain